MIDTKKLKEAADAATPGPWNAIPDSIYQSGRYSVDSPCELIAMHLSKENAEFIATFNPSAVSELLARVEGVEAERAVFVSLLRELDGLIGTIEADDSEEEECLDDLRNRILKATAPIRNDESDLLGIRAAYEDQSC